MRRPLLALLLLLTLGPEAQAGFGSKSYTVYYQNDPGFLASFGSEVALVAAVTLVCALMVIATAHDYAHHGPVAQVTAVGCGGGCFSMVALFVLVMILDTDRTAYLAGNRPVEAGQPGRRMSGFELGSLKEVTPGPFVVGFGLAMGCLVMWVATRSLRQPDKTKQPGRARDSERGIGVGTLGQRFGISSRHGLLAVGLIAWVAFLFPGPVYIGGGLGLVCVVGILVANLSLRRFKRTEPPSDHTKQPNRRSCLHCDTGLSPADLADGWCPECGMKLPASWRADREGT